jgi:RecJ-like exonuclease
MSGARYVFTHVTRDGDELEISLPARFEVCPTCEGKGSHVNRAIDGNGLTREDFDQDPDFAEGYFRGDYDVRCEKCKGARVVAVVDGKRLTPEQRRQLKKHEECEAAMARDDASERWLRMAESGERW